MAEELRNNEILAADGTPIGEVADEPSGIEEHVEFAPAVFDERTGYVKRIERAMSPEAILDPRNDNDPDLVPGEIVNAILPDFRNEAKREKALSLYVEGEYSLHEIAGLCGVPDRTVAKWAELGNWIRFQEEITATLKKHERVRLAQIRLQNRERLMKEQLELGGKINKKASAQLDSNEDMTPGQLKMAAEAAKLGSDMTNRALGIGESGKLDDDKEASAVPPGAVSLVQVFKTGGVPVVESRETIDVQATAK